jgi:hypothetical protein
MSRNLVRPYFPIPPGEYQQAYFAEVVRAFSNHLIQMQNPGEGRNTGMVFTNLQTDDVGLEPGGVFQQNGILKVSLADTPNVRGSSSTGAVGSVTVTIA